MGSLPTGVAATDTTAVVANSNDNTASIIDLTASPASVSATVSVGRFPAGVAISGTTAYVANFNAGTLSIINLGTDTVTHTVTVGSDPDGVLQVGSSVYVSNLLSGTISVVDPVAGTVTHTITLTGPLQPAPSGLAASGDGHHLYVDDVRNGSTIVVDLTTNPATQDGAATVGTYPAYLAVDGTTGYVANANLAGPTPGTVSVVDLANSSSPSTTSTVGVGSHPYGIAESPFLGEAIVSNSGDGTLDLIDTSTNTKVGSPVPVGNTPDAVAITPDQTTALVTNEGDNDVSILHINQPPSIVVPGSQSVAANDSSSTHNQLTFSSANGNALSASDSDANGNPEQVTLSVAHGTLTLASTSGLSFSAGGNGQASMTFTGTLANINTALDGTTYEPGLNYTGPDTLTASIDDQGNTGDIGKPETTTHTVSISVSNGGPTAGSPSFSGAIGNTVFGVGTSPAQPSATTSGTVLTGSSDPNGDTLSAVSGTIATTDGGSVAMNTNGSFTYTPPVGTHNTSDTFTFQVTDGTATSSGTATINIGNAVVWYVDSALGTNGNGESTSPFNNLASVNSASTNNGDVIFLFGGASQKAYAGNLTLKPSQILDGQSNGLDVLAEHLMDASGVNPIIKASSGADVTIDNGTVVHYVDEGQTASGVTGISGSTVTNFSMNGNSDTADNGINLSGTASGMINVFGTINSAAHSVQITQRNGGTVNFSGSVNDTGSGVSLTNNTGATIGFTGGLTVATTGSHPAFTATGGGTVKVTGAGNTLNAPGATALDVENTAIDASGLTFKSISSGSTSGPARGIYLNSTGTAGGLTVTGTGTTAGSGGTIQNGTVSTSTPPDYSGQVEAVSTGPISLSNMTVNNATQGNDIGTFDATGLTLTGDTITNAHDQGVLYQLGTSPPSSDTTAGAYNITNSTFTGDTNDDIYILDESSGTTTGTISGNTIGSSANKTTSATNGTGILFNLDSNKSTGGTLTTSITNNTITGAKQGFGIQGNVEDVDSETSGPTMNATVTGNTIDLEATQAQDGMNFGSGSAHSAATLCLDSNSNTAYSNGRTSGGAPFDAVGESLYQNGTASTYNIKGGPVESTGPGNEDPLVESYENSHNTLTANTAPTSQPSFALQEGSNGFTSATSCPTVSSPALVTAHTTRAKAIAAAIRTAARAHIRAHARHARAHHRLTRAQRRARIRAYRRELAALLARAARGAGPLGHHRAAAHRRTH